MVTSQVKDCQILEVPRVTNPEGNIGIIEGDFLPFQTKRVYYLYDVPSYAVRGGHAHKELYQFLIPVSGSFDVVLNDGTHSKRITLNKPDKGLLIVPGIWRELENFSSGSVCLVLASAEYNESDYIRNEEKFKEFKNI